MRVNHEEKTHTLNKANVQAKQKNYIKIRRRYASLIGSALELKLECTEFWNTRALRSECFQHSKWIVEINTKNWDRMMFYASRLRSRHYSLTPRLICFFFAAAFLQACHLAVPRACTYFVPSFTGNARALQSKSCTKHVKVNAALRCQEDLRNAANLVF